jgi:hypothetical protein
VDAPEEVTWKSDPIPERWAVTLGANALLETVKVPFWDPTLGGVNITPVVHVALSGRDGPQVLFTSLNPEETERFSSVSSSPSFEFMIVSMTGLLAVPTPVVGKFTWAGTI